MPVPFALSAPFIARLGKKRRVMSGEENWTNFSEYATGQAPSDWTRAGAHTWSIVDDSTAPGGKKLRITAGATRVFNSFLWTGKPAIGPDAEVLVMFAIAGDPDEPAIASPQCGAVIMGTTSPFSNYYGTVEESGVGSRSNGGTSKHVSGTYTALTTGAFLTKVGGGAWALDTRYYMRVRKRSSDNRLDRLTMLTSEDPSLYSYVGGTDTSLTSGRVGVMTVGANIVLDVFFVSYTSDGTAPPTDVEAMA